MKITIRHLLTATALVASTGGAMGTALADGPGDYGYDTADPNLANNPEGDQVYQPPPEGVCFDDNNQTYDCSKDEDYGQYNQLDDGYDQTAYQDFRDELAPHGQWIDNPQYGQVWVPSAAEVGTDFTPYYSGGRWVLSDYGWTWVSEHSWGWAPFHYGRWLQLGGYGWSWIPGRVWGPAWVHWRAGGGYVGWAALPPRGVRIAPPMYGGRGHYWNFVAAEHLTSPRLFRVAPSLVPNLYMRTTIANDYRSIGSMRIIVGPPSHQLPMLRVAPTPLRSLGLAMPRGQIVVRAGIPMQQRPYYAPYGRSAPRYQPPGYQRPPYGGPGQPSGYPHPGYPAPTPGYPRPGYPAPNPGYPRPGYPGPGAGQPYPHPGYPGPGTGQPYPRPGYPGPGAGQPYPHPGNPGPGTGQPYPHPGYPGPGAGQPYPHPGNPGPGTGQPYPHPGNPGPGAGQPYPHPGYPGPAPSHQPPSYPSPSPGPMHQPPPAYPRPSYPSPAPMPSPMHQPPPAYPRPSYPSPAPMPSPMPNRPSYQPPMHSGPSPTPPAYHPAPSAPAPHAPAPGGHPGHGR